MKVIICSDCGNVMKRLSSKCTTCTRTNLEYYEATSPKVQQRIREITGQRAPVSPVMSSLYVLMIAMVVTIVAYEFNVHKKLADLHRAATTAAAPGAIPQ